MRDAIHYETMAWFKREDQKLPVGEQVNRVPEGLWIKCTGCREIIYRKDVLQNASVCPKCAFHFRITARERLELLDNVVGVLLRGGGASSHSECTRHKSGRERSAPD